MATVTNPGSFMATITHPTGNGYCRDRILRDRPTDDLPINTGSRTVAMGKKNAQQRLPIDQYRKSLGKHTEYQLIVLAWGKCVSV